MVVLLAPITNLLIRCGSLLAFYDLDQTGDGPMRCDRGILTAFVVLWNGGNAFADPGPISDANDPHLNGAQLVDFDSPTWPIGEFPLPEKAWKFGAVTIRHIPADGNLAIENADAINPTVGTGQALHNPGTPGSEPASLEFIFDEPASALGFLFGASNDVWLLELFSGPDESSRVVTLEFGPVNAPLYRGGFDDAGRIRRALFRQLGGGGNADLIGIDDLRYVPEPSTWLLATLAAVGYVAIRRRR